MGTNGLKGITKIAAKPFNKSIKENIDRDIPFFILPSCYILSSEKKRQDCVKYKSKSSKLTVRI